MVLEANRQRSPVALTRKPPSGQLDLLHDIVQDVNGYKPIPVASDEAEATVNLGSG